MSRTIPTINTSRLTLRGMRAEDFGRYADIWAMPDVVKYISGDPWPRSKAWSSFLRLAGHWQITGFGVWAVQQHRDTQISGQVGFSYNKRDLGEDFDAYPEAGWVLDPAAQGQGFGLEASQAAHDWFDRVVTGRLVCMVDPRNAASVQLAEGIGYTLLREADYEGDTVQLWARKGPPQ